MDDLYSLCSALRTSAARSPMMTQGAMVLPVVTRGMMDPSAIRSFSIPVIYLLPSEARNATAFGISSGVPSLPSGTLLEIISQFRITAPGAEDVGAFVHKLLRRRKADAAIGAGNERNFPFKLTHLFLLRCHLRSIEQAD